jgi:hypothetical protein
MKAHQSRKKVDIKKESTCSSESKLNCYEQVVKDSGLVMVILTQPPIACKMLMVGMGSGLEKGTIYRWPNSLLFLNLRLKTPSSFEVRWKFVGERK